nr:MAG TPA: hypothetical protein [Caudoviricetes sp.]
MCKYYEIQVASEICLRNSRVCSNGQRIKRARNIRETSNSN